MNTPCLHMHTHPSELNDVAPILASVHTHLIVLHYCLLSLHLPSSLLLFFLTSSPPPCPAPPSSPAFFAVEEKKLKLKSPNFVVSETRLSVRNIPLLWTEKQLKQAAMAAVSQPANQM